MQNWINTKAASGVSIILGLRVGKRKERVGNKRVFFGGGGGDKNRNIISMEIISCYYLFTRGEHCICFWFSLCVLNI